MNTHDALIKVGDSQLGKSSHGRVVVGVLKSQLSKDNIHITPEMSGFDVLSAIYDVPDPDKQERLLALEIGVPKDRTHYRTLLTGMAFLISLFVVVSAAIELNGVVQGNPGQGIALLEGIINHTFRLFEILLTGSGGA